MSIYDNPFHISHEQRLRDQLSRRFNKINAIDPTILTPAQKRKMRDMNPTDRLIFLRNLKPKKNTEQEMKL
jgi:hypothetical protein